MGEMGVAQSPLTAEAQLGWNHDVASIAVLSKHQPLCGDAEGWGPVSSLRFDFTPCFLDIWIVFVAAWGIVAGAGALWYLLRTRTAQEVPKNWHFYSKLYGLRLLGRDMLMVLQNYHRCPRRQFGPSDRLANRVPFARMDERHPILHIRCCAGIAWCDLRGPIS